MTPNQKGMVFVESIKSIIASSSHNLDFIRYTVSEIAEFLISAAFSYKQSTNLSISEFKDEVMAYHLYAINEIHYQMPNLGFKELAIGLLLSKSELFLPSYSPDMEKLGIRKDPQGYREQPDETIKRTTKFTRILSGLLSDDAYIGRLWHMLSALLDIRHNWL
jgi:hypothetical protein